MHVFWIKTFEEMHIIYWNFEFLSISYLVSELFLLMLYSMLQDYGIIPGEARLVVVMNEEKKNYKDVRKIKKLALFKRKGYFFLCRLLR